MEQERSNEELCMLAKQGDGNACLQLLKQNRAYIVEQMTKMKFRYHPYWQEMIEWGEVGILSSIQDYDPSYGTTFLTFATYRIETELRNFLHSIRMAYMENYYSDDEDEEGDWAGEELCFLACQELRPLEKMFLSERRDVLLYASMDALPELERKYIDYHYGFATGKPMPRTAVARILGVPVAEAKRIEADALNYQVALLARLQTSQSRFYKSSTIGVVLLRIRKRTQELRLKEDRRKFCVIDKV